MNRRKPPRLPNSENCRGRDRRAKSSPHRRDGRRKLRLRSRAANTRIWRNEGRGFCVFFSNGTGIKSRSVFLAATRCADEYRIRNTDLKALLSSLWQRRYTGRGVSQLISPGAVAFAGPPGFHHYDVPPDVATAGQAGGRERDDSRVPPSCAPQPANPTVSSFFSCSYGGVRSVTVSRCDRARRRWPHFRILRHSMTSIVTHRFFFFILWETRGNSTVRLIVQAKDCAFL